MISVRRALLLNVFVLLQLLVGVCQAQNGGYALKFNGTDGAVSAAMTTGNTNSTATIEMWFAPVATQSGVKYLADLRSVSGTNSRRVMPFLDSGVIGVYSAPNVNNETNAISVSTGVSAAPNVWHHVAITINGATLKVYVDGKLYTTTSLTDSYALTGTEVLTLASDYLGTAFANIKIDEVRVWSSERSQAEINAYMHKELAGSEAGLLAYYRMSNGSGTTLADNQTAAGNPGTLAGGVAWVASAAFADTRQALGLNGSDQYVNAGNGASVQRNGTQAFTLEAWVKPTAAQWGTLISKFQHSATHEGYSLEVFSDYRVALLHGNNWSDWNATTSSTALAAGIWSHVAATYDGSVVNIYINGVLSASTSWSNGLTDPGTPLLIGARMGTSVVSTYFAGQIDEARVWSTARTAAQIRETMGRPLAGDEAGLSAYFRLDELEGTTLYDATSNGNHGTLVNGTLATVSVASGAPNTWVGADSSDWSAGGNWAKGTSPVAASNVGLYKWPLGSDATLSGSPTVTNLAVSSTSTPTLNSGFTVNGNLILESNLDLNGQAVTLGTTSYLVEGSGYAHGTSGTISTTRNLSNIAAQDVALLGARITSTANLGSTTITRGHAQQGGGANVSILRYFDIVPTNNSGLNATLAFNYRDTELNGQNEAGFQLYRSTDAGATWASQGGTVNAAGNLVTQTGIGSFSRWTVADTTLVVINGACGGDNGQALTSTPTNLCLTGSPSAVTTGTTSYTWSCDGSNGSNAACSAIRNYIVTPSAGANGSITPNTPQQVAYNATPSFTVTANPNYIAAVGGSCGGSLAGTTYTTSAVTAHCNVAATFVAETDGVDAAVENAAPNGGDGNGDGIPDSQQQQVASLLRPDGGYLTIATDCAAGLTGVQTYTEGSQGSGDTQFNMPYGLVGFSAACESATFTIHYHGVGSLDGMTYRKYGPTTPGNAATAAWYTLPGVTFGTATVGGQTVATATFTLNDNQLGDDTGDDGLIVDQGGPGSSQEVVAIPTLSEGSVILLAALLAMGALLPRRRQRV